MCRSTERDQRSITGVRRALPSLEAVNNGGRNHRRRVISWRAVLVSLLGLMVWGLRKLVAGAIHRE